MKHEASEYSDKHLFEKVWDHVWHDGRYRLADWVVKTDPDTVFLPNRLHGRLGGSSHAGSHATFYANCGFSAVDAYLYGPLQVFSSAAVDAYYAGWLATCRDNLVV